MLWPLTAIVLALCATATLLNGGFIERVCSYFGMKYDGRTGGRYQAFHAGASLTMTLPVRYSLNLGMPS